ncbi:DUF3939 domain-containing protein [Bacillus sp. 2205SS5-2]|uniref:DUF3939 domain-containing protein n=1 Tax=Bacillus sp. 2205SS5-2 TaxID=3109031 RepID=UPI0030063B96
MFRKLFNKESSQSVPKHSIDQAISEWGKNKHDTIDYSVLLKNDQSIDYTFLKPYLKTLPSNNIYMSRHTFKLYEESEKHRMYLLDTAQDALFLYLNKMDTTKIPTLKGSKKLNQHSLILAKVIEEPFPVDLYIQDAVFITDEEQVI